MADKAQPATASAGAFYLELELPLFSSLEDIKAAYRRLARQYHPDLNRSTGAEDRFKAINAAYEGLKTPEKKQAYDAQVKVQLQAQRFRQARYTKPAATTTTTTKAQVNQASAPASAHASPSKKEPSVRVKAKPSSPGAPGKKTAASPSHSKRPSGSSAVDFGSLWRQVVDNWQKASQQTSMPLRDKPVPPPPATDGSKATTAANIETTLTLTAVEAQQGSIKTLTVRQKHWCKTCSGTGRVDGRTCDACIGTRFVQTQQDIEVRIPAGVTHGARLKVAGKGQPAIAPDMAPGDLIVTVQVPQPPRYEVRGLNTHLELDIPVARAVLGGDVVVSTPQGPVTLTLPPGTESGRVFRLKEQGVHQGQLKGDQFVTVKVRYSPHLSPAQRKLYEQLLKLEDSPQTNS